MFILSSMDRLQYTSNMQAYFPSISQPEGLPLKVQDAKGKEWIFQFRFWPNNNSRMYVLEGVTPCIQSMQLQAGDIGMHITIKDAYSLIRDYTSHFISLRWHLLLSDFFPQLEELCNLSEHLQCR